MSSWTIESIPAYCITLERRNDRWKRFQDQSGIDKLDMKRFLGVDGKTLDIKNDDRVSTLTKRNILAKSRRSHEELDSIGGVGCALSHIALWEWLVNSDHEMMLVMEDDAIVPPDFVSKVNGCIERSMILKDPKKWDLWLLGGIWEDLSSISGEKEVVRMESFILFHAYVITKRMARILLKDVYPIQCHIDAWVSIYAYLQNLRIVGSKRLVLPQNTKVKTDIQVEKSCKICNVSSDFDKSHKLITNMEWQIARTAEGLTVAMMLYLMYRWIRG